MPTVDCKFWHSYNKLAKGIEKTVVYSWWQRFCQRHTVSLRTAVPLSLNRAKATDPFVIERHFDLLEETLRSNGLLNGPTHLFNCNETGMPLSPKSFKVVAVTGSKNPCCITGNTKSQITIMACTSASGAVLPPICHLFPQDLESRYYSWRGSRNPLWAIC